MFCSAGSLVALSAAVAAWFPSVNWVCAAKRCGLAVTDGSPFLLSPLAGARLARDRPTRTDRYNPRAGMAKREPAGPRGRRRCSPTTSVWSPLHRPRRQPLHQVALDEDEE